MIRMSMGSPTNLALQRLRQEDSNEFKTNFGYLQNSVLA